MFKNVWHIKKYVARMQVTHLLNINSLGLIWSSLFFFNFEQASEETCFSYKIFILVVLELVYYSFLEVKGGNLIAKLPFGYVFAKLLVKIERNFYQRFFFKLSKKNLSQGCLHNLTSFCKWFAG